MRLLVTTVQLLRFGNPKALHYLAVFFERDSFPFQIVLQCPPAHANPPCQLSLRLESEVDLQIHQPLGANRNLAVLGYRPL